MSRWPKHDPQKFPKHSHTRPNILDLFENSESPETRFRTRPPAPSKGSAFAVGSGSVYAYPALEANLDGLVDAAAALEIAERAVATAAVRDAYSGGLLNLCVAEKGAEGWRRLLRRHAPVLLNT